MAEATLKKVTTTSLRALKAQEDHKKIVAITAYDYTFGRLVDEFVDVVLVGDSLGMVIQGNANTLSVKLEEVIYHTRAVARALKHAHLVADMPFLTYQTGTGDAIRNAGRLLAEGGAEAVKLEGGVAVAHTIEKLTEIGMPVMGHIGLTPQSVHAFGGYKVQGRSESAQQSILQDALALEDAGVYSIVLEGIPAGLAKTITERVSVPTIGIGAGAYCDGQILVVQDLLGMDEEFQPRFVKRFAELGASIKEAVSQYAEEVQQGRFPDETHSF